MDRLLEVLSNHVNKETRIEIYSSLNHQLINDNNVVLWNNNASTITTEVYDELKLAISRRNCRFYTLEKTFPYYDFCMSLLCTVDYTLNHKTMSTVKQKSFHSAWRLISVISVSANKDVQDWIKDRIGDRDASKYCKMTSVQESEGLNNVFKVFTSNQTNKSIKDANIISRACRSKNIVEIVPGDGSTVSIILNKVTSTPEGQLDNLRIIHSELLNN